MAYDIGPKIGIEGEAEFRKSIKAIEGQVKSLGNELKAVTAEFADNANSMEALTAKSNVLDKSIAATEKQLNTLNSQYEKQTKSLAELGSALEKATKDYGENSKEAAAAQNAYNQQYIEVTKLETSIGKARTALANFQNQQKQVENQIESLSSATGKLTAEIDKQQKELDDLKSSYANAVLQYGANSKEAESLSSQISSLSSNLDKNKKALKNAENMANKFDKTAENMADSTEDAGDSVSSMTVALGNFVAKGIETAVSAIVDMVGALWNLDEATEEYRIAQGKLQTAFEAAGYSVEDAEKAYTEFYKILGDTDTATEASQLLAQLADNEEDLSEWTNIAAGVYGTFGDALPIEGLIEAANETVKVGEVTGTLADALNWAGISEDEFNEKLAACSSESQRNNLIMQTLSQTYDEASEAFYRNNESIIAAREAQAQLDDTLAGLGETIANVKNSIANELAPSITSVIEAFNGIITGAEGADTAFADAIAGLSEKITAMLPQFIETGTQIVVSIVSGIIQSLPSIIEGATDAIITFADAFLDEKNQSMLFNAGLELIVKLTEGILKAIPKIVDALPEIIDSIVQFLLFDSRDQMAQAGADLFIALVENLPAAILAIQKMIPEIIIAILAAIGEGVADMAAAGVEWGENLIAGFVEGIKSKIRSVQDAVKGVISAAAEFIGFHSPAKKGEGRYIVDWGANMISGFLDGVESMMGDVSNMGNNVTAQMANALSQPTTAAASGITLTANISVGSIRNDQDIKAISTALNRQVRNWGRSLGVV